MGDDPEHPLELTALEALTENIRNVRSPETTYPSTVEATAMVFGSGPARLEGRADFLAKPHAATTASSASSACRSTACSRSSRATRSTVQPGTLSAARRARIHARGPKRVDLEEALIEGVRIDYVSDPELTAPRGRGGHRREARPGRR